LTADGTGPGTHTYQWNGEGRLVTVDNGATIVLVYNALGQQVGVTKGGTDVVWHLKSPADKSQGDYSIAYVGWNPAGVFFLGEKRVGFDVNGGIVFLHQNNLNSVTVPTTFEGSRFDDILYYPWGQYWEGEGFVFAGMDHYWEDVLHNTPNRQYAFYEGRWLSPDPLAGDITNPQSLNRYAYVLNNPCGLIDPLGLDSCNFNITIQNNGVGSSQQVGLAQAEVIRILRAARLSATSCFSFSTANGFGLRYPSSRRRPFQPPPSSNTFCNNFRSGERTP
jgi:RHS repeat-associated protein